MRSGDGPIRIPRLLSEAPLDTRYRLLINFDAMIDAASFIACKSISRRGPCQHAFLGQFAIPGFLQRPEHGWTIGGSGRCRIATAARSGDENGLERDHFGRLSTTPDDVLHAHVPSASTPPRQTDRMSLGRRIVEVRRNGLSSRFGYNAA